MNHLNEIVNLSERRTRGELTNEIYILLLIEQLILIRKSNLHVTRVAQTLFLGIIPEGGDGS